MRRHKKDRKSWWIRTCLLFLSCQRVLEAEAHVSTSEGEEGLRDSSCLPSLLSSPGCQSIGACLACQLRQDRSPRELIVHCPDQRYEAVCLPLDQGEEIEVPRKVAMILHR